MNIIGTMVNPVTFFWLLRLDFNTITQLYSFNYKDRSAELIHAFVLNYPYIIDFNPSNSLIVTGYPSRAQIQFLNTTKEQTIINNNLGNPIMDSSGSKIIFWNTNEMMLMSFNRATVTFKQIKVISIVPSNELSLLSQIESINYVVTILLAIAIILVSYAEKIWRI